MFPILEVNFKKIVKGSKDIVRDTTKKIKNEYDKIQQDREERQRIRDELVKSNELKEEELFLERQKLRIEQEKVLRTNPIYSQDYDNAENQRMDETINESLKKGSFGIENDGFHTFYENLSQDTQNAKTDEPQFQQIINQIITSFRPQRITNEEHLQSQITIFLQTKFQGKPIRREVITSKGDKLDILLDEKYVFEVKVPQDRTALRNLSAQLEEYKEEYPAICAIIFDEVNLGLSNVIKEYARKYREKYGIPSIIITGERRGA